MFFQSVLEKLRLIRERLIRAIPRLDNSESGMRNFLQGRIDLAQKLRTSALSVHYADLVLILTSVISACAAWRWPGRGFDAKRFIETLVHFNSTELNVERISIGGLLELELISEAESPWASIGDRYRIFTGDEIDGSLEEMSLKFPTISTADLKKASYAALIYRWLRCGYAHEYWAAGNTTHVAPSNTPGQISYIGRLQPDKSVVRMSSFHLEYLFDVTQQQVSKLSDKSIKQPDRWWIDEP